MNVSCGQCFYFDAAEHQTPGFGKIGTCRRKSPEREKDGHWGRWPGVNEFMWCGDFKAIRIAKPARKTSRASKA